MWDLDIDYKVKNTIADIVVRNITKIDISKVVEQNFAVKGLQQCCIM